MPFQLKLVLEYLNEHYNTPRPSFQSQNWAGRASRSLGILPCPMQKKNSTYFAAHSCHVPLSWPHVHLTLQVCAANEQLGRLSRFMNLGFVLFVCLCLGSCAWRVMSWGSRRRAPRNPGALQLLAIVLDGRDQSTCRCPVSRLESAVVHPT